LTIELRKELEDQIVANPQFRREQDPLMRHNWGEKTRRSRIDLGKKSINRMLPLIAPAFIEARSHALVTSDYESHSAQSAEGQD
jgi:hypothetical protein